jgi:di/tricarboxylate transporter
MAEVILPASSELVGKTEIGARFRDRYGVTVIGLRRGASAHERGLKNEELKFGDTLLVVGPWMSIRNLQADGRDLVVFNLPAEVEEVLPVPGKALQAVFCLVLVVVLMVSGVVPNVQAALIGCLLMGALGCIDLNSAYRAIDWKTIVLIVGMLPFSLALAKDSQASPYPFAMIVALAASTAFMTPVSSPVNTLVVTPGNYRFGDFVRVGVPFSLIVLVVSVLLVPWLLPL